MSPTGAEGEGLKYARGGAHFKLTQGLRNDPISPLRTSLISPSTAHQPNKGARDELLRHPGDEQLERKISQQLGPDGDEILGMLFTNDDGQGYGRLMAAGRTTGEVPKRELDAARLAYAQRRNVDAAARERHVAQSGRRS